MSQHSSRPPVSDKPNGVPDGGIRIGVFPGSFDPVHNGHVDLIERARKLFDVLYIAVLYNEQKQALFSVDERIELLRGLVGDSDDCRVESFSGLLVDYARDKGAVAVVRGLRSGADFDYELPMTLMNRRLAPGIDTIFLLPAPEWIYLSSRLTKEVGSLDGDLRGVVPPVVLEALRRKLGSSPPVRRITVELPSRGCRAVSSRSSSTAAVRECGRVGDRRRGRTRLVSVLPCHAAHRVGHPECVPEVCSRGAKDPGVTVRRTAVEDLDQHFPVVRAKEPEQARVVRPRVDHRAGALCPTIRPPLDGHRIARVLQAERLGIRLAGSRRRTRFHQELEGRGGLGSAVTHPESDVMKTRLRPVMIHAWTTRRPAVSEAPQPVPHTACARVLETHRHVGTGTAEIAGAHRRRADCGS